ncbi:MAG: type II toxin-antitoxin system Phd/YefM family antitoxin [Verrucomicrobiales bacterium]
MTVTATEFKARCLSLMDGVKRTHEPILITKHGEVVAQLVPPPSDEKPWLRLRGTGRIRGDLVSPAIAEAKIDAVTGREVRHGKRKKKNARHPPH